MSKSLKRIVPFLLIILLPTAGRMLPPESRFAPLVEKILKAWEKYDLVCLGEDHGRKHDSDLRIALVRHPRFPEIVRLIAVEFANASRQDVLDRFILDGGAMTRDEIGVVWRDASNPETWECPIYEEFLRAVREVNLALPREKRIRVICGDGPIDWPNITKPEQLAPLTNRGGNIRKIIAEKVLDKKTKALAIYGSGHMVKMGMGFPGELSDRYPNRMWSISSLYNVPAGKKIFGLGNEPAYFVITGTKWESAPVGELFPGERAENSGICSTRSFITEMCPISSFPPT